MIDSLNTLHVQIDLVSITNWHTIHDLYLTCYKQCNIRKMEADAIMTNPNRQIPINRLIGRCGKFLSYKPAQFLHCINPNIFVAKSAENLTPV